MPMELDSALRCGSTGTAKDKNGNSRLGVRTMKQLSLSLVGAALLVIACSSDGGVGTGKIGARDGGETGGTSSAGGASGAQCKTTADCPQRDCFMCPAGGRALAVHAHRGGAH